MDERYLLEYETKESQGRFSRTLVNIIPKEGYNLYEVKATYIKSKPLTTYYVIDRSRREALNRFQSIMTHVSVCQSRKIAQGEERDNILRHPRNHVIF